MPFSSVFLSPSIHTHTHTQKPLLSPISTICLRLIVVCVRNWNTSVYILWLLCVWLWLSFLLKGGHLQLTTVYDTFSPLLCELYDERRAPPWESSFEEKGRKRIVRNGIKFEKIVEVKFSCPYTQPKWHENISRTHNHNSTMCINIVFTRVQIISWIPLLATFIRRPMT
jgi:hypothetical protein